MIKEMYRLTILNSYTNMYNRAGISDQNETLSYNATDRKPTQHIHDTISYDTITFAPRMTHRKTAKKNKRFPYIYALRTDRRIFPGQKTKLAPFFSTWYTLIVSSMKSERYTNTTAGIS